MHSITCALGVLLLLVGCAAPTETASGSAMALHTGDGSIVFVGATLVDNRESGRSTEDVVDSVVVIQGDRITAVGRAGEVEIPKGSRVIDARGRWIVPGLIDSFATLNDQSYADAYLSLGVTSIVAVWGGRRGPLFEDADPAPRLFKLEGVGLEGSVSTAQVEAEIDRLADTGHHVALLMYGLTPKQLDAANRRAHARGMATIGELARTTYADGMALGLDAFVHTTRYSLDAAPRAMAEGVAREPFSDDLASAKWRYYRWLSNSDLSAPGWRGHIEGIGRGRTALIPTLSLLYLDLERHGNPWTWAAADRIDPLQVHSPAGRHTGRRAHGAEHRVAYAALAERSLEIEAAYHGAGARHVAGSGTDVWGTMPGISLHTELDLLQRVGLTPREVLAAATLNPAEVLRLEGLGEVREGYRADLLVLRSDPTRSVRALRDIEWVVGRGELRAPRRASHVTPMVTVGRSPGGARVHSLTYRSGGHTVRGYVAVPPGEGPFPVLVRLRGGNRSFGAFDDRRALRSLGKMADWGYVVVAPQYRGSEATEDELSADEFGGAEVEDVLAMLEIADGLPQADPTRVGIEGWSRGGMTAFQALRRSARFRAAVVVGGISDLERMIADRPGMLGVLTDAIRGDDDEVVEAAISLRSAVRWAEDLDPGAPVLLLHGGADWRVNEVQSMDMARALDSAGVPHRLVIYEGADHSLKEVADERDQQRRAWFDRFVRDGEPLPNPAPHGP